MSPTLSFIMRTPDAQVAIEVPVTAVPLVAASMQQLLEDKGAAGASACAETLAFLTAGCMVGTIAEVLTVFSTCSELLLLLHALSASNKTLHA